MRGTQPSLTPRAAATPDARPALREELREAAQLHTCELDELGSDFRELQLCRAKTEPQLRQELQQARILRNDLLRTQREVSRCRRGLETQQDQRGRWERWAEDAAVCVMRLESVAAVLTSETPAAQREMCANREAGELRAAGSRLLSEVEMSAEANRQQKQRLRLLSAEVGQHAAQLGVSRQEGSALLCGLADSFDIMSRSEAEAAAVGMEADALVAQRAHLGTWLEKVHAEGHASRVRASEHEGDLAESAKSCSTTEAEEAVAKASCMLLLDKLQDLHDERSAQRAELDVEGQAQQRLRNTHAELESELVLAEADAEHAVVSGQDSLGGEESSELRLSGELQKHILEGKLAAEARSAEASHSASLEEESRERIAKLHARLDPLRSSHLELRRRLEDQLRAAKDYERGARLAAARRNLASTQIKLHQTCDVLSEELMQEHTISQLLRSRGQDLLHDHLRASAEAGIAVQRCEEALTISAADSMALDELNATFDWHVSSHKELLRRLAVDVEVGSRDLSAWRNGRSTVLRELAVLRHENESLRSLSATESAIAQRE
eukprot:gnl/TRDRNA2_/TRDRNA2_41365_c0_seq1.p1 gnl/TRDRNA2_/TRDRNA2_41365_c0~~gnl/TRDRNA2_/TRDRNA2_41365_c0_seq1.p1  ORF type:complete len:555 (+),score=131.92 gnl/TRDRNA2_/TRDRNA2_41365_c0_seq1:71-1735(+)